MVKLHTSEVPGISEFAVASGGSTVTGNLPNASNLTITSLTVTMVGKNANAYEAPLAAILKGMGTLEVTTKNTQPVKITFADLFYFNRDYYGKQPHLSNTKDLAANDFQKIALTYPLNPVGDTPQWGGKMGPEMGMAGDQNGVVKITTDTDANASQNTRTLTCTATYVENAPRPASYMGAFQVVSTALSVGDTFWDIQGNATAMMGAYVFGTTGEDDLTLTDAPTIKHLGWGVGGAIREKFKPTVLDALSDYIDWFPMVHTHAGGFTPGTGNLNYSTGVQQQANASQEGVLGPQGRYHLMDLGLRDGLGIPKVGQLQVYIDAGATDASRTYPLLAIPNQA